MNAVCNDAPLVYGRLTVLERKGDQYLCRCACGREVWRHWQSVRCGKTKSCGCLRTESLRDRTIKPIEIGSLFGRLTVVEYSGRTCKCRCECGNTIRVASTKLRTKHTQSCGCYQKDQARNSSLKEVIPGTVYNRLTVLEQRGTRIFCRCKCGNTVEVDGKKLRFGHVKSCGCLRIDQAHIMSQAKILPSETVAFNSLYAQYQLQASLRQYCFELSEDDFRNITQQLCHFCGAPPAQLKRRVNVPGGYVYNGIDRLDNALGYTLANSVAACWMCNNAKLGKSEEEFLTWARCLVLPSEDDSNSYALPLSACRTLYNRYKNTARRKQLVFELDEGMFYRLVTERCHYCRRPRHRRVARQKVDLYTGIDRKDTAAGYTVENCVSCCWDCNNAKGLGNYDDLLAWARRVVSWTQTAEKL